mgnify:CR=1 FL=1
MADDHIVSRSRANTGAQTARRALQILKLLRAHHADGLTTREIVTVTGEERSAVQRALATLIEEGLVQRGVDRRRFHLGIEAMHIGRVALRQPPLIERHQFALQRVARLTGDTVFLSVRVGDFILCVHRDEGSSAVRAPRTRAGDLRVLGTTAGGLALLSGLPDDEIRQIHGRHAAAFDAARMDLACLQRHVLHVRRQGHAVLSDNVSEGVTSVGVCLADAQDEPFAAVAIAAASPRMGPERVAALYQLLRSLDEDASTAARSLLPGGPPPPGP